MPRVIAVTGLPASGKTTVGRQVAAALGLRFLDKDDLLEASFPPGVVGPAERARLSRAADGVFRVTAEAWAADPAGPGLVLVSFWRHPSFTAFSGTPIDWLPALVRPGEELVELYCTCPPAVASARFLARRRHRGHGDAARDPAEVLAGLERQHAMGPLGLGRLVVADTTAVGGEEGVLAELR